MGSGWLCVAVMVMVVLVAGTEAAFTLAPLPYAYDALEPHIDTLTMQLHHDKHHQAYTDKFNEALDRLEAEAVLVVGPNTTAESILRSFRSIAFPSDHLATAVRNHGGGYVNHNMFWHVMTPGGPDAPQGDLAVAIDHHFGSLEEFKKQFGAAAASVFGSGWAWLVIEPTNGDLKIVATPNQDSPLMAGQQPVLCLDVWEHAYYLLRHNRRPEYIQAWWNVVNWAVVQQYYEDARSQTAVDPSQVATEAAVLL